MRIPAENENVRDLIATHPVVILQFTSALCSACGDVERKLDTWSAGHPSVVMRRIPCELFPALCGEMAVFAAPTVFLYAGGHLIIRKSGVFSVEKLLSKAERLLDLID